MFYSRQLLARKAPLGQIWMAATLKGKLNRKDLVKLNIIKICEEIMNPSVPMALRLSGILMGGVVIVYERKVKLLYDDVNRLLVELNQAWKIKVLPDPTVLPKGKSQAKRKSITLPEIEDHDLGELEPFFRYTDEHSTMLEFTSAAYIAMRLDNLEDPHVNQNSQEDYHQADAADITMVDLPDPFMEGSSTYNRFERFDIEGDEETPWNFTTPEDPAHPSTIIPSPPPQEKPQEGDGIFEQHPVLEEQGNIIHAADEMEVPPQQNQLRPQGVNRRRVRRPAALAIDDAQSMIPGHIFHSWLQDTSDISSRKRHRNKKTLDAMTKRKIAHLMDLPPIVLVEGLYQYGFKEVHFPTPLLELWRQSTQHLQNSESGNTSTFQHHEPTLTAPSEGIPSEDPIQFPFEDFHTGAGSVPEEISIEKQRENVNGNNLDPGNLMFREELRTNTISINPNPMGTPGNSADEVRSIPSSGSGHHDIMSHTSEGSSSRSRSRSKRKRPISPSRNINYGLEPVDEENSWKISDPNSKSARLTDNEIMLETGPTQTQKHTVITRSTDPVTNSVRMHLKAHFETPGGPKVESLNHLTSGMDRKRAASLFYQMCVLASEDSIKVEQKVAFGDIFISRGAKM